jgi:hypothetical protein
MSGVHVLLIHGADGLAFAEDRAEAERRGAIPHPLRLPAFSGDPVADASRHYDAVSDVIATEIASIRAQGPGPVAAIGRNLGGSLLAWHAARCGTPDILVMTGAIHDLARFRAESDHEGARNFRARISGDDAAARVMETAALDLVATLPRIPPGKCLLQAGRADPWLDEDAWAAFERLNGLGYAVERLDDDHAMVSPKAIAGRWDFILRMARQ